jgi:hypothetical protein
MVARYALFALFSLGILTAGGGVSAAPGYSESDAVCVETCRKEAQCFGGPGAHDGSPRCKRCVARCTSAQKKQQQQK